MKLKLKATPEQVELIKRVGDKNRVISMEAQEAFAAFITDVTLKVLNQAGTTSLIFDDLGFNEDDQPSIPLDLYYNVGAGYITVWSQTIAGGLATSQPVGVNEMKVSTYTLNSAISFLKKHARKSRLDVIATGVQRMSQELLLKKERNGWSVIMKALANASTKNGMHSTASGSVKHVIRTENPGNFLVDDLSNLMTRVRRANVSFDGGSTVESAGLTDLCVSPEIKGQIRGFAYNPMNSKAGITSTVGTEVGSTVGIPLPDSIREDIYRSAGTTEIFGVNIIEMPELGQSQKYNTLFDNYAGGTTYATLTGASASTFVDDDEEILVGFDLGRDAFKRVYVKGENDSELNTQVDDQFVARQDKVGYFTQLEEGRVCINSLGTFGLII